jgi:hypothetical protein
MRDFASFVLILLVYSVLVNAACADQFQIKDRTTGLYISFSRITCDSEFNGYTDKYGRVNVNLPDGNYSCRLQCNNHSASVMLHVTGTSSLKAADAACSYQ